MRPPDGGHLTFSNITTEMIITWAYQLKAHNLIADPRWNRLLSEHFDVEGKVEGNPPRAQMRLMLQSLLADRFKLAVHRETRQLPVYALILSKAGKTGPHFIPHSDDAKCIDYTAGPPPPLPRPGEAAPDFCDGIQLTPDGHETGKKISMDILVANLSNMVDRPVVDRTGLSGTFDFTLDFALQQGPDSQPQAATVASDPSAPPSIFTAIQEQLGLKLESTKAPVDVLVIDNVEEPSPN